MTNPILSIIIPTYNRPHLLPRAVNSALAQTVEDIEVIVVDDASPQPVQLPEHPKLRIIRLPENSGGAAARNAGAKAARGRWITYLDDDDELLPHMVELSLEALAKTNLPKPVAALSGIEVVNGDGEVIKKKFPPTLALGSHFCLEDIEPGQCFNCKQTMVVERDVLLGIGGFDESFRSRVHTELFLRLNPVCSIVGLRVITYRLFKHKGSQVSKNSSLRQVSFSRLIHKHKSIFQAHPKGFAKFVLNHARRSYELGQIGAALFWLLWAMRLSDTKLVADTSTSYPWSFVETIPELVKDGVSAFLLPERDAEAIAEKVHYLIEHPEIWSDMGKAGRKRVEQKYDIQKLKEQLVEIYQQMLDSELPQQRLPNEPAGVGSPVSS